MTSLSDAVPLSAQRDLLHRYVRAAIASFDSVAGEIIAQRLAVRYVRDPIRPALLLWACAAVDGELADALPVAAAFDLFDRFMLLHDELADERAASLRRWGLGQSLNAGDALYALAFRSLASDVGDPARRLEAARLAGEAVLQAIEGRDGAAASRCALSGAALQAGAIVGGAPAQLVTTFAKAGRLLGAAGESPDAAQAQVLALESIALLRECTRREDLEAFEEAALYVARRAA